MLRKNYNWHSITSQTYRELSLWNCWLYSIHIWLCNTSSIFHDWGSKVLWNNSYSCFNNF